MWCLLNVYTFGACHLGYTPISKIITWIIWKGKDGLFF